MINKDIPIYKYYHHYLFLLSIKAMVWYFVFLFYSILYVISPLLSLIVALVHSFLKQTKLYKLLHQAQQLGHLPGSKATSTKITQVETQIIANQKTTTVTQTKTKVKTTSEVMEESSKSNSSSNNNSNAISNGEIVLDAEGNLLTNNKEISPPSTTVIGPHTTSTTMVYNNADGNPIRKAKPKPPQILKM